MYKVTLHQITNGDFPLNHDCILKVRYINDCPLRFEYFTCRSCESGSICLTLQALSVVRFVEISSVDKFGL